MTPEDLDAFLEGVVNRLGRLRWEGCRPVPDAGTRALGPDYDWRVGLQAEMKRWKR